MSNQMQALANRYEDLNDLYEWEQSRTGVFRSVVMIEILQKELTTCYEEMTALCKLISKKAA